MALYSVVAHDVRFGLPSWSCVAVEVFAYDKLKRKRKQKKEENEVEIGQLSLD